MNGTDVADTNRMGDTKLNGVSEALEPREVETAENASTRSAGIEGSLGSDTDTSKADVVGAQGKDAVPKYSVRRSATFKPVSVTKNLLAKTSSASTPTKTSADKGIGASSSTRFIC